MALDQNNMIKVLDVRDNRRKYEDIMKKNGKEGELDYLYKEWSKSYFEMGSSLIMNTVALQNSVSALKTKKIDPYIAGGAANGAFGLGAGLAAAGGAYSRNASIDSERTKWGNRVIQTSSDLSYSEKRLMEYTKLILENVYEFAEAKSISIHYQSNKEQELNNEKKQKEFKVKKEKNNTVIGSAVGGAILAIFFVLFYGFAKIGETITVFIIAWIICFIMILVILKSNK